jgi:cytoskeletal protein RodZ
MAVLGGLLAAVGFLALIVAVVGLVKQRLRWTRIIATRRDAAFLFVGAFAVMIVGAAISPNAAPSKAVAESVAVPSAPADAGLATEAAVPSPGTAPSTTAAAPSPTATTSAPPAVPSAAAVVTDPAPAYTVPTQRAYTAPPVRTAPPATTGTYNGGGTTDTYTNVDGNQVERPDGSSAGASARCNDGSYSHSQHRSGTCSGHDGVSQWLSP